VLVDKENDAMDIYEVDRETFAELFPATHIYNSVAFAELNSGKVERVRYLTFSDTKQRFGVILGERDRVLRSPFSAPFGGFIQKGVQNLANMEHAASLLTAYATEHSLGISVTLPPLVYDASQLSKWAKVLMSTMTVRCVDLNYHMDLSRFPDYRQIIDRSARNKLNHALRQGFRLVRLDGCCHADVARAYEVIRRNRAERGYPLRMTLEQVWKTVSGVVKADFFVLEHEGRDVAAAQVFHVAEGIVQVIYWGDIREYSELRPMNYLAYSVAKHYYEAGMRILDIGPSTENGVPNHGLCEFKEDTGCSVSLKYSFVI